MFLDDLTITSLETITSIDENSGELNFILDELQNAKIANTQDKTDITGKGGRKLNSLKKNKAAVVSGTSGLVSAGLLEAQTGSKFADVEKAEIRWTDYLTISGNKATTSYKAVGTTGNEIEKIYVKSGDFAAATVLTQDATVGEGKFTYTPSTKEISFNDGDYEDGTEIVVTYIRNIKASVLENASDVYSKKSTVYIDAFGEDKCNKVYRIQFKFPRADFSGNFDIDMGENQTVHAFEIESLAGACGTSGNLWTWTVFGEGAADAA